MECSKTNCGSNIKGKCSKTEKDRKEEDNKNVDCFWTIE